MSRSYRPSNGTEGMDFCEAFCFRCVHDLDEKCDILTRTLIHDPSDPEYPSEWVIDAQGARCTAFLAAGDDPELAAARADERQMELHL